MVFCVKLINFSKVKTSWELFVRVTPCFSEVQERGLGNLVKFKDEKSLFSLRPYLRIFPYLCNSDYNRNIIIYNIIIYYIFIYNRKCKNSCKYPYYNIIILLTEITILYILIIIKITQSIIITIVLWQFVVFIFGKEKKHTNLFVVTPLLFL